MDRPAATMYVMTECGLAGAPKPAREILAHGPSVAGCLPVPARPSACAVR